VAHAAAVVTEADPGAEVITFGHVADGNVHVNIVPAAPADGRHAEPERSPALIRPQVLARLLARQTALTARGAVCGVLCVARLPCCPHVRLR